MLTDGNIPGEGSFMSDCSCGWRVARCTKAVSDGMLIVKIIFLVFAKFELKGCLM